jgi:hypothetical protein
MRPGKNGEVVPVLEDELASIIAYALASEDYSVQLQNFYRSDFDDSMIDFSAMTINAFSANDQPNPTTAPSLPSESNQGRVIRM